MNKDIFTLGYEIPGYSNLEKDFTSHLSLMDADFVVISPQIIYPSEYGWVIFTAGGGCYDVSSSKSLEEKVNHLKKELTDMLNLGKNIFLFLTKEEIFQLAQSVSHPRKGQSTYNTMSYSNYSFLPIKMSKLTSASGTKIKFVGNHIFNDFNKTFGKNLSYEAYIEDSDSSQIIYTGKDKSKILGAIFKAKKGHLIALPKLNYDEGNFLTYNEEEKKSFWTKEAISFGKKLIQTFIDIDQKINNESEKTPIPEWALEEKFRTEKALLIDKRIKENSLKIETLKKKSEDLVQELNNEDEIKNLLYENGTPLENAVTNALKTLGYEAENYDDGTLELDQVILSPEHHRFIGECEGRDSKDINITKFRQLLESLNADFARDDVQEKAYGILFGNPQRLIEPNKRDLDFTEKCKIGAKREKIALVKTPDLFNVIKYLKDNDNEAYKKECRDAIYKGLGKIVKFPKIPK